jgi:preprotein translocase subunit SecA
MVSRTIEGAQSRVEGYNFDARKHVVQYDDVINRQRETIYHERERILRSKDLSPTILTMLDEEISGLVLEHTQPDEHGDWNRAALKARLLALAPSLSPSALARIDEESNAGALTEAMSDAIAEAYEKKRTETGEEGIAVLERVVLLRVIDSLWVEHLTAVDDMRRGIGLRAYSQRDPLNEFKVEAYRMFDELKDTIRHDVTHNIFRVSLTREPLPQAPRRVTEGRLELAASAMAAGGMGAENAAAAPMSGNGNGAGPAQAPQPVRAGPKVGRNDPCWCGSGKKYKRCHGA